MLHSIASRRGHVTEEQDIISLEVLASVLMHMFEFAPVAMAITTADTGVSRYTKVNEAYLRLTGLQGGKLRNKKLTADRAAINDASCDRRQRLLAQDSCYELEEVDIAHASGSIIPTLMSAQRTVIDGMTFDVEVIVDMSSHVRRQQERESFWKTSAHTDALSGLPNRACFDGVLAEAVTHSMLIGPKFALAFIDLNGFKAVNDVLGHAAGDEVIRSVAKRLRQAFQAADFVARIGGDEFVIILNDKQWLSVALQRQLQETMEQIFEPISINGQVTQMGAAVGVTFLRPEDTVDSFVKRADAYMYTAKATRERIKVVSLD